MFNDLNNRKEFLDFLERTPEISVSIDKKMVGTLLISQKVLNIPITPILWAISLFLVSTMEKKYAFLKILKYIKRKKEKKHNLIPKYYFLIFRDFLYYHACLYKLIKSSFVTSLGFPGLHGSCIAFSASISISSSFAPTSPTV